MILPTRPFNLVSTGTYLPKNALSSSELDHKLGRPTGWCEKHSKVKSRYHAEEQETFSFMGARALKSALERTGWDKVELDMIISASASKEQLLPFQAAAISRAVGLGHSGVACFDVDSTCLSFVTALDIASMYLQQGQYKRLAIVSSEVPSRFLNWEDAETAPLFGDGAVAVLLEASASSEAGLIASHMQTFSEGYDYCRIRAGGTRWNLRRPPEDETDYFFRMEGRRAFRLAAAKIGPFLSELFARVGGNVTDVDLVVPHQASPLALAHIQERLGLPEGRMVNILASNGNQVAASIPFALSHALETGRLQRGQTALLLGSAAGLSLGAALMRI